MLPAGQAGLPRERRVAGGIDESGRGNHGVTKPGCEKELANSRAVAGHVAQDRAEENRNAGFLDRLLDPARQRDLIVHDDGGVGGAAPAIVEGSLGAEVAQNLVGDTMGELTRITLRPRRAPSSAAEIPAMPAPSTQMSPDTRCAFARGIRRTIRVAVAMVDSCAPITADVAPVGPGMTWLIGIKG